MIDSLAVFVIVLSCDVHVLSLACVHTVVDANNADVTVDASSTIDGAQPEDILYLGTGWEPASDSPDVIHNVTISLDTDEELAEFTNVDFVVEGIDEIKLTVLNDGVPVDSPITILPDEDGVVTIPIANTVGNQVRLQLIEDSDPLTDPKAGSLKVEACFHPYVSTTMVSITTGISGVSTTIVTTRASSSTGTTEMPGWTEWSPWTDCSATCGMAIKTRNRECEVGSQYIGQYPCPGPDFEEISCELENCPTTPGWTEWTSWSECDVLCGEGEQTRLRECSNPPPLPGQNGCIGSKEETVSCTENPCQCIFDMSAFKDEFGYEPGEVIGYMEKDGIAGATSDSEAVRLGDPVGEDAVIYVDCNVCTCETGSFACNHSQCDNCTYTPWTEWTDCSASCNVGQRSRTRTITGPNLQLCTDDLYEAEDCNTENCPTEPEWSPWSEWSNCTTNVPCDAGTHSRTRECLTADCGDDSIESETCIIPCDEEEAVCTNNKVWSECANACNQTCQDYRLSDFCVESECLPGCSCPEGTVTSLDGTTCIPQDSCPCYSVEGISLFQGQEYVPENEPCKICTCSANHTLECTVDPECCDWEEWGSWGDCSVQCGDGSRNRYRSLKNGVNCGSTMESEPCSVGDCPAVCFINGVAYDFLDIISDDFCEKCYCNYDNQTYCVNDTLSVVDGGWAAWSPWSDCSSSCTGGAKTRTRTCSDPLPSCGGAECPGANTDSEDCNVNVSCCETGPLSDWSECSATCGDGIQERVQEYADPAYLAECGELVPEYRSCNYGECNITCVMSDWSEWSPCSVTCGEGTKQRGREPVQPAADCPSNVLDDDVCYMGDCVCEDNFVWSNNSLCQRTCDERFSFNESLCAISDPGCVCPDNYFLDDNGNCVNNSECDACYLNGTRYEAGEIFDSPEDACYSCECVSGHEECTRKCEVPVCGINEVLSYDVPNECCPICVPVPDTCQKYTESKVLYDEASDCITDGPVNVDYCSGGCGNSTSESILMMALGDESAASDCRCCQGVSGSLIEIKVYCGVERVERIAHIREITECQCNVCVETLYARKR